MHFMDCEVNDSPKLRTTTNTDLRKANKIYIMFFIRYSWILIISFVSTTLGKVQKL